jgi:hypothetical protein
MCAYLNYRGTVSIVPLSQELRYKHYQLQVLKHWCIHREGCFPTSETIHTSYLLHLSDMAPNRSKHTECALDSSDDEQNESLLAPLAKKLKQQATEISTTPHPSNYDLALEPLYVVVGLQTILIHISSGSKASWRRPESRERTKAQHPT